MKRNSIILVLIAMVLSVSWVPMDACMPVKNKKKTTKVEAKDTVNAVTVQDTLAILTEKAKQGDLDAAYGIGCMYYNGTNGVQQDYKKAARWFSGAADKGHALSTTMLATCYRKGHGVEQDSTKALKLYMAAAKRGDTTVVKTFTALSDSIGDIFANKLLANCFRQGVGVKRNSAQALHYAELAASAGDIESIIDCGLTYYNGKENRAKALPFFEKGALMGDIRAAYFYGLMLYDGDQVAQDKIKGLRFLQQAADGNHVAANTKLGQLYLKGDGVTQDKEKGAAMIKKAAEFGNEKAQWILANCYRTGEGVTQDYDLATHWMALTANGNSHKAYEQLMEELKAKDDPFYSYLKGLYNYYIARDFDAAGKLFKAVEKKKVAEGKTMQAVCLASKHNAKANPEKAVKLFQKAIKESPAACYYLALMTEDGNGTKKDAEKALELLTQAADGGNAYAQCYLGDKYILGNGVGMDMEKAVHYYLLAEAQKGLTPESAKHLAKLYENNFKGMPQVEDLKKHVEQLRKIKESRNLLNILSTTKF